MSASWTAVQSASLGEGDLCVDYLSKDKQVVPRLPHPAEKISWHYGAVGDGNGTEDPGQWIPAGKYQSGADQDRLCSDGRSLIIKSKHEIDHIFSELYSVDERIQFRTSGSRSLNCYCFEPSGR